MRRKIAMKKSVISFLSLTLLTLFLCASGAAAVQFVNITTGPTGGTYYPVGSAIVKIWTDNIDGLKASAQSSGGTMNNIQLLASLSRIALAILRFALNDS